MQCSMNILYPTWGSPTLQLFSIKGLDLLSRELLQLDMSKTRDKMLLYNNAAISIGSETSIYLVHILKPVFKILLERLLWPCCKDTLSQLVQNRSPLL